ncbi:MAG: hypothetical protein ACRBBM_17445 [Pseudomonadaceae bacterium]
MPVATTYDALRASLITTIAGITPSYTPSSASLWCPVQAPKDVPSSDPRNFYVRLSTPVEDGEVYGGCLRHTAELEVITSYGGLSGAEQDVMTARDNQDLWRELHRAGLEGGPKFAKDGFNDESDDGRQWGAHVFTVTFFMPLET